MLDLIVFVVIVWAFYRTGQDVNAARRADRDRKLSPAARTRGASIRHGIGWWAREVIHGFPVTTAAWQKGWLAHHAAALQHQQELEKHRGVVEAFKAVGQQGQANTEQIEAEQIPTGTRQDRKRALALITTQPGQPADPTPAADPEAEPVPAGLPPTDDNPNPVPAADPDPDIKPGPSTERKEPTLMPTQTVAVPEVTYDQLQTEATKTLVKLELRHQELRVEQWANIAEHITGALRTGNTVANASDMADQIRQEIKIVQARIDSTHQFKAELRREHGGINQAVQDAPVPAAQPEFYEG